MAVNLIDSNDITISKTGDNIQLNTSVNMQNVQTQSQTNATDINNLKSGEVYSTTEVKTNKVWINDKPIYRKVLQYTYSTTGTHQESLSSFNIDTITSYNWNCLVNNTYIINAYDFQDNNAKCNLFFDKNKIYMINGTSWTSAKFTLILEYTKSS